MNKTSLLTMSVHGVIDDLREKVLGEVPQGITNMEDVEHLEVLLGKLPNDYAYVVSMLGYARNYVRELKRQKDKDRYEDMMDKRDALENIASAIKLQYQGVSRMLTAHEQRRDENGMWEYRKNNDDNGAVG